MEFKNDIHLQPPDKEKLIHSVQILKEKMLENEKKMMDILKAIIDLIENCTSIFLLSY